MRPEPVLTMLLAAGGCQDARPEPPPPAPEPAVVVRDPDGRVRVEARVAAGACEVTGETTATVARGAAPLADLRVVASGGRIDLLDLQGVPLARIAVTDRDARVVDAGRRPVAVLVRDGGRIAVTDGGGAALAYVAGTSDLATAALFVAPGVPAAARAHLACERLLATPGSR